MLPPPAPLPGAPIPMQPQTAAAPASPGIPTHGSEPTSEPVVAPPPATLTTQEQLAAQCGSSRPLRTYRGEASYYSDALAGRTTASGAPYDPAAFTAAHRSLPFGTVVRVRRLPRGPAVYARVTDRGPFGRRGRIIDLSRAAAERLGMLRIGVVPVVVEVLRLGKDSKR
jgi:rare lipoprotein A